IRITMADDRMHIVDNGLMPDVCVQHMAALILVDGKLSFASTHDHDRMHDEAVLAVRRKIELIPSPELSKAVPARQAIVEIECNDGRKLRHHAKAVRGTPDNPMTDQEIEDKAIDLIAPVTSAERGEKLVDAVRALDTLSSLRELRS